MINATEMKILNFMKSNLGKEISIRQLSDKIKASYQPTHKHANDLEKEGVLKLRKQGNSVFCSLRNTEIAVLLLSIASIYELETFIRGKVILKKIIDEFKEKMKEKILALVLFGSYAKGKENKKSDIDLLCIGEFNTKKDIDKHVNYLEMKYGKEINVVFSDTVEFKKMLQSDKQMVGKEALGGIIFFGFEHFWRNVLEVKVYG